MATCPQCDHGWVIYMEDDHPVRDVCYHCSNSGEITEDQLREDHLAKLAESMAAMRLEEFKQSVNEDPYGDGWDFRAAEAGISVEEYNSQWVDEEKSKIMESLLKMPAHIQKLFVNVSMQAHASPSPNGTNALDDRSREIASPDVDPSDDIPF